MTNESLFKYAESQGHEIYYRNLSHTKAITLEQNDRFYIALAKNLSRIEEKELTAHELGHCEYGGTYHRTSSHDLKERAEYRANKWAYYQLAPPDAIAAYVCSGIVTPWDLAEQFDVSCEFMGKAIEYYQTIGIV